MELAGTFCDRILPLGIQRSQFRVSREFQIYQNLLSFAISKLFVFACKMEEQSRHFPKRLSTISKLSSTREFLRNSPRSTNAKKKENFSPYFPLYLRQVFNCVQRSLLSALVRMDNKFTTSDNCDLPSRRE